MVSIVNGVNGPGPLLGKWEVVCGVPRGCRKGRPCVAVGAIVFDLKDFVDENIKKQTSSQTDEVLVNSPKATESNDSAINKSRIQKHLRSAQKHLEAALEEFDQANGCGANGVIGYSSLEDVLEKLSFQVGDDDDDDDGEMPCSARFS